MKCEEAQFDKEFETRGTWWLPGQEANSVSGTLTYHPDDGLRLDTLGDFSEKPSLQGSLQQNRQQIILGHSEGGTEITLHRCLRSNLTLSLGGGHSSQSFRALEGFFGKHFQTDEELNFRSIAFSVTHLESWLGALTFKEDWPMDGKPSGAGTTLKFHPPQHFKLFVPAINTEVESSHSFNTKSDGWFDRTWTYRSSLLLSPIEPKGFNWFTEQASSINNLLSLLTGERTYFRSLSFFLDQEYKSPIYFVFAQQVEIRKKSIHPPEMLAPYPSIALNFDKILDAWFRDSHQLGPVHDLLFSVLYKPDLYIQSQFLHLMQAVETYHRRTRGGHYLSPADFKDVLASLKAAIPNSVSKEYKEVLTGRLSFQNDLSLRSRIKSLVNDLPEVLKDRFLGDSKLFTKELCETRDYLTHYDKESPPIDYRELAPVYHQYVTKLMVILTYYLLRQIEIPAERICDGILQRYHYLKKPVTPKI